MKTLADVALIAAKLDTKSHGSAFPFAERTTQCKECDGTALHDRCGPVWETEKMKVHRIMRCPVAIEMLCVTLLAVSFAAAPALSESTQPAAKDEITKLTHIPVACASSSTQARRSCLKDIAHQVRRLSSPESNARSMQGLPILDQKAATTALCDVVKAWADQSLTDIQSVWKYLEAHEPDWPSKLRTRVEASGKQQEIGVRLLDLREKAGLGKPCGWVAWGSFKTFGSRVAASQQSAPEVVAEIAEALSKGLARATGDSDALEASKAFLRVIGNAANSTPK